MVEGLLRFSHRQRYGRSEEGDGTLEKIVGECD